MASEDTRTTKVEVGGRVGLRLVLDAVRLTVTRGPDEGRSAVFTLPTIRIGSDAENDFPLTDRGVSRFHAELRLRDEGGLELEDMGSTNGIFLGGAKVQRGELGPGVRFELGSSEILVDTEASETFSMVEEGDRLGPMIGSSPAMQDMFGLIQVAAPTMASVMIHGETGTGKELVARTLHERSGREGPLVVFDAATCQRDLVQSTLFGHTKGAFTGADKERPGAFRAAHGGTLFLDEIGELPLEMQPNLLRALEAREVKPVGSDRAERVDVRVVSATHRDLGAMVEEGTFRRDLYHRLAVVRIEVPPLRKRPGDIDRLVDHLVEDLGVPLKLGPAAREAFRKAAWHGNVRQLRNAIEALSIRCHGREVKPEDVAAEDQAWSGPTDPGGTTMADVEREKILDALERHGGNRSAAARELGISRVTIWRRLKEWGLDDS